jgi:molecular chaperone GrpE
MKVPTPQPAASPWTPLQQRRRLALIEADLGGLMRSLAESKAAAREKDREHAEHLRRLYLSLLDSTDALERVFNNINAKKDACTPQMNIWINNFRTVHRLLRKVLSGQGVVPIENLGVEFDPQWHEIEQTTYRADLEEGTIVEEVQKGYLWKGKELLRHARVVVTTRRRDDEGASTAAS